MKKENADPVIEPNIKNPEPKEDVSKIPSSKPTSQQVNFNFTDEAANEEDMTPVRDILSAGQEESEEMMMMEMSILTVDEVATFLKGSYDVQGWFTYPELWKRDNAFFYEIAAGILPQINAWAVRVPAIAHAVKTVSAAGSWGRLIWDMAGTYVLVVRRRQLEAEKKKEEEEQKQNGYQVNYSKQQQPATTPTSGKQGFIIP